MAREKRRKGENPCLNETEMPLPRNMTTRKRRMSLTRYTGLLDVPIDRASDRDWRRRDARW